MRGTTFKILTGLIVFELLVPHEVPATQLSKVSAASAMSTYASLLGNGSFDGSGSSWASPWTLQVQSPAQATMAQDTSTAAGGPASAVIRVTQATQGANDWYTALVQSNLSLVAGSTYTLSFWAKSSTARPIAAGIQQLFSPYGWRVINTYTLSTGWQQYTVSFVAPATESPLKLQLNLGQAPSTVWIDNVSLTSSLINQAAPATTSPVPTRTATALPPTATATATATATDVPPTATAALQSSEAGPLGQSMPVGDLPGWHQIFTENFASNAPVGSFPGSVYGSKWTGYVDGQKDTTGNGHYYPSKVLSVNNGVLNMYLHTENGVHMVAAPVPIIKAGQPYAGMLYGRYTIRFKTDSLAGNKTSWLLWPDSETWPADGEIDLPEGDLNSNISAFTHWEGGTSENSYVAYRLSTLYGSAWHTATTEWTPSAVTFYLDGQVIGYSTSNIPNTPMHWVVQAETSTFGVVPSNSTAGNVQVDWVTAYSYQ
jgi:hypothetical protein